MFRFIEEILNSFRSCFSRGVAHNWFMTVILSLIVRDDKLGVTSFVRAFSLRPSCYDNILHFFRSSAWKTDQLKQKWHDVVREYAPFVKLGERLLILGDGSKVSKESRHMPAVKKLFQESENSSKAQYVFGHLFGGIGIVIGNEKNSFCLPLDLTIQDGLKETAEWVDGREIASSSHVLQMVKNSHKIAQDLGNSYLVLDRYFLTVPALEELSHLNETSSNRVDIITRAKSNCTAYQEPTPVSTPRRGRPRKKGDPVKLDGLFDSRSNDFITAEVMMYGQKQTVQYLCLDLLWGIRLYQKVRFILTKYNGSKAIFVSTDCELDPTLIIEAYAHRFKIECMFRELKQQICAFGYHFWTSYTPRLNKYKKKTDPDPLSQITDEKERKAILAAVDACERFVLCAEIAIGITQLIALKPVFVRKIQKHRYLRTSQQEKISEATVLWYLRKHIFRLLSLNSHSPISRFILSMQESDFDQENVA